MWFDDNKPTLTKLSSAKILDVSEDRLLEWIILMNNKPVLWENYKVQIEHDSSHFSSLDIVSFLEFLKIERTDFYEKYKLLLT